jgi:hypothetical protein
MGDNIDHDDLCPICQLLLFSPVTTSCGHTMCSSCMTHWAEVSVTETFREVPLTDEPTPFSPEEIEVGCPMCRTSTKAVPNAEKELALKEAYTVAYDKRKEEEESDPLEEIITMTVYVGNTHEYKPPRRKSDDEENAHEWTFFVRPERSDIIDQIRILLVGPFYTHSDDC